ncbi:MAG: hypothetical protein ACYDBX_00910 [Patescibacteria group bacterium]
MEKGDQITSIEWLKDESTQPLNPKVDNTWTTGKQETADADD